MRKYGIVGLLLTVLVLGVFQSAPVRAEVLASGDVRVGLESKFMARSSILVNNLNVSIGYESGGAFAPMATVAARNGFGVRQIRGYYVSLPAMYGDYATARRNATDLGTNAVPHAMADGMWMICAGPFDTAAAAELYAAPVGATLRPHEGGELVLTIDDAPFIMFGRTFQLAATDAEGLVSLDGARYRGRMEFAATGSFTVSAVNVAPMHMYLYGVVPCEMPSGYMPEALKAQAVAARTYAASKSSVHTNGSYTLCDTTHCQVYGGVAKETGATTSAVDATRGVMAYYDGKPIEAMFFASSGGFTESSGNVWGSGLPYLVSVAEMNEPPSAWKRTFSFTDLDNLATLSGANIGYVQAVTISAVSAGGRVQELTLTGSAGVKTLKKEEVRTFFSKSTNGSLASRAFTLLNGAPLPSQELSPYALGAAGAARAVDLNNLFAMGKEGALFSAAGAAIHGAGGATSGAGYPTAGVSTVPREAVMVTFSGSGNGHGVGMSQNGAQGMAQLGYTYEQILRHYYTGVDVR